MGCASSAPSSAILKKKQKEKRDQMKTAGGYNDAVANILDEAGNAVSGGEGVVSFFAETNFRKLSDAEDYMKSRILDPSRKTTNKFIDKATTWAPDAGDYLEKKLMRDKTRFQNKLVEEKERKEKEKEEKDKEKEKKKLKSTLLEATRGDKKKSKKDKIKSIKKAVRKSKKDDDSDNDRSTSPGESLLDSIAIVHERARKEKIKRALLSRKGTGLAATAAAAAKATKKTEGEEEGKTSESEKKPEDEIEPLDIASSRETLKPREETREVPDSPIGSDSDIGADLKIEDMKIDDSASTAADTSVYETETDADDIYDDAGISASSVSLDDLLTAASDSDSSSEEASISTIADRRKETKAPVEKAPKKIEESAEAEKAPGQTD